MSKPHNIFERTISRGHGMLALARVHEEPNDDLLRAACVLGVAAYDHFFTSKFCDVLASYLRNNSPNKELIILLERAGLNTASALELAIMKRPFRRIRSLLSSSLSQKTTNRTKSIDNLFAAIDLPGLSGRVHKQIGRKNIGKRIDKLVDMRNDVVHSGHINSHGSLKAISIDDVESRLNEITRFVDCAESIINEWVKEKKIPSVSSTT